MPHPPPLCPFMLLWLIPGIETQVRGETWSPDTWALATDIVTPSWGISHVSWVNIVFTMETGILSDLGPSKQFINKHTVTLLYSIDSYGQIASQLDDCVLIISDTMEISFIRQNQGCNPSPSLCVPPLPVIWCRARYQMSSGLGSSVTQLKKGFLQAETSRQIIKWSWYNECKGRADPVIFPYRWDMPKLVNM